MESVFKLVLATAGASAVTGALAKVHSSFTGLVGIASTLTGSMAGVKSAIGLGGELHHLSLRTGQSVKDLYLLESAYKRSGMAADNVAPSIARLQKAIDTAISTQGVDDAKKLAKEYKGLEEEGYGAADAFGRLGINVNGMKNMPAIQQMQELSRSFSRIESPVERAAIAMKIFGRSGTEMLQLFRDSKSFDLPESTTRMAHRLEESSEKFEEVDRKLGAINSRLKEMWVVAATGALPSLEKTADVMRRMNLSGVGAGIGSSIAFLLPALMLSAARPLDKLVVDTTLKLKSGILQNVGFAASNVTGLLAKVLPIGLAAAITAAVVVGVIAAIKQAQIDRITRAAYYGSDKVAPSLEKAGNIRSASDKNQVLEDLIAQKKELENRIWTEATRFFGGNDDVLWNYRTQLLNVNNAIKKLGDSWADARIQQNLASDRTAEAARREAAAVEWLGSEAAKQAKEKVAESAAAHQDQDSLLVNQRAMYSIQAGTLGMFVKVRQVRALTKAEEAMILSLQAQQADLLKGIEKTEKSIADIRGNRAKNSLEDEIEQISLKRATLQGDFSKTEAEKWFQRRQLLTDEISLRGRYLTQQKEIRALMTSEQGRAQGDANVRQAQKDLAAAQQENAGIGANPFSFVDQAISNITRLRESWGTLAEQMGANFTGVIGSGVSSVTSNITNAIVKTQSWDEALRNIKTSIGVSIVQAIVDMGVKWGVNLTFMGLKWLATKLGMMAADRGVAMANVAATLPIAQALSMVWAGPATLATVASMGTAAAVAPAELAAAMMASQALAMLPGFSDGGWTGKGGIVHANEFVFSAPAVANIGRENLEAMHQAGRSPAPATSQSSPGSAASKGGGVRFIPVFSIQAAMREAMKEPGTQSMIVDIMKLNRAEIFEV